MSKGSIALGFLFSFCAVALVPTASNARPESKSVKSGKTQVVANVAGREITLSELRAEMGRLQLSPSNPEAERISLDAIVARTLLSSAAKKAELHRRPEAMAMMRAAQDQALADLYMRVASQPAEPTRQEVEEFIIVNPSLFAERRTYEFSVLTMPTEDFDEEKMTDLFSEEVSFAALETTLEQQKVAYTINSAVQSSTAFPKQMREQLGRYEVRDNIVLKADHQTRIMKIMGVKPDRKNSADWPSLARRFLLEEQSRSRAVDLLARLRTQEKVTYYRKTAAPKAPGDIETASAGREQ